MDIILISDGGEHTRRLRLPTQSGWCRALLVMVPVVLVAGAVYLGYWIAPTKSRPVRVAEATAIWNGQVAVQRRKIQALRADLTTSLRALARKLGRLQARTTRLTAVGKHMVKAAGLDPDGFSFADVSAVGGPRPESSRPGPTVAHFKQRLQALSERLDGQERRMRILRDLMITGRLRQADIPAGRPVNNAWISSVYGWRTDPFTGNRSFHPGTDFAVPAGSKVMAVAPGVVIYAGWLSGYGLAVKIDHGNGYVTLYGHNRKLLVSVGERVDQGEVISRAGSTGRSTGPHVHFEVIRNGRTVDPAQYIRAAR